MKKILFPYELGSDNRNAFMHAAKIASLTQAELIILNVYTDDIDYEITAERYKNILKTRLLKVADEVSGLKSEFVQKNLNSKLKLDYKVVFGTVKLEIIKTVKKDKIELIVITAPYEKKEDIQLTGNNLKSLFNDVEVPILVVPENHEYSEIKRIGYATNLNRMKNSTPILQFATEFTKLFGAKTHFMHVSSNGKLSKIEDKKTYDLIEKLQQQYPNRYSFEVLVGNNVISAVSEYIKKWPIDLVIVIKQNRNFFEAMFHESFTNQFSLYSKEPILILHERDDNKTSNN